MKKFILLLIPILCACGSKNMEIQSDKDDQVSTSSIKSLSLRNAFDELSSHQESNVVAMPVDTLIGPYILHNPCQTNQNVNDSIEASSISEKIFSVINQDIPLRYMINGANNQASSAFIFAKKLAENENEILVITRFYYGYNNCYLYGVTDDATLNYIQSLPVEMEGENIRIPFTGFGENNYFISGQDGNFNFNGINFNQ